MRLRQPISLLAHCWRFISRLSSETNTLKGSPTSTSPVAPLLGPAHPPRQLSRSSATMNLQRPGPALPSMHSSTSLRPHLLQPSLARSAATAASASSPWRSSDPHGPPCRLLSTSLQPCDSRGTAARPSSNGSSSSLAALPPLMPALAPASMNGKHEEPSTAAHNGHSSATAPSSLHQQLAPWRQQQPVAADSLHLIPGLTPEGESRLRQQGIHGLRHLSHVYTNVKRGNPGAMQAFLKDTVGIVDATQVAAILTVMQFQHAMAHSGPPRKTTVSVEGNISAGKSTFLRMVDMPRKNGGALQVVPEPVARWQDVGGVNLLDKFYADIKGMAYKFQHYVFVTRADQERSSYAQVLEGDPAPCRVLERSVFSDSMVFVRAMKKSGSMDDTELRIYAEWFKTVVQTVPSLVPDGFIYLKASAAICHERMKRRARSEETGVPFEYLQLLEANHEDWLGAGSTGVEWDEQPDKALPLYSGAPYGSPAASSSNGQASSSNGHVVPAAHASTNGHAPAAASLNGQQQHSSTPELRLPPGLRIPAALRADVRFLDCGENRELHPWVHQVPTLTIECGQDVDVDKDLEYHARVAEKVELFMEFIGDLQKATAHSAASALYPAHADNGLWTRELDGSVAYLPKFVQGP